MRIFHFESFVFAVALLSGSSALAEESTSLEVTRAATYGRDRYTVEVKPFPAVIGNVAGQGASGVGAVGAGFEWLTGGNFAAHADATYLDSNLMSYDSGEREEDTMINTFSGYTVDVGARYYQKPKLSSWYTGAKLGVMGNDGSYKYKDREIIKATSTSFTPGLEAGYRWLIGWQQDFVIRLGIVAAANAVQARSRDLGQVAGTSDEADARQQLDDRIDQSFLANIDLGLGYVF